MWPPSLSVPDVAVSGSVLEEPAVRGLVLPANIASVFPQQFDLLTGVAGVPQGVPQVLTWTRVRLDGLFKTTNDKKSGPTFDCSVSGSMSSQLSNIGMLRGKNWILPYGTVIFSNWSTRKVSNVISVTAEFSNNHVCSWRHPWVNQSFLIHWSWTISNVIISKHYYFFISSRIGYLQLDAWFCHGSERICLPVDLFHLLPHHHVETGAVLVPEDKPCVVVVRYRVHMKRPFKVYTAEGGVAWWRDRCHRSAVIKYNILYNWWELNVLFWFKWSCESNVHVLFGLQFTCLICI